MTTKIVADDVQSILAEDVAWDRLAGRTVLVTGATGMVGQYVTRTLLELNKGADRPRVLALTRQAARAQRLFGPYLDGGELQLVSQDVADPIQVSGPVDVVVHAASPANPVTFRDDPVGVIRANVTGTQNVLDLAARTGAVVCLLSSLETYGRPEATAHGDVVLSEDDPGRVDSLDVRSAYPESKRLAENLCVAYGAQHGVGFRIARLSHTYGPGMDLSDSRVQAYLMRQALNGESIELQSDGTLARTYTYVSDAVSALFYMLCSDSDITCNIANEQARVTIRELAETVLRHGGSAGATVRTTVPAGAGTSPGGVFLDCSLLRGLGWHARVDLDSGIARTIEHHRAENRSSEETAPCRK
jgi:UDP-glucuronate decarboxylase